MGPLKLATLYSEIQIQKRVKEMGQEIADRLAKTSADREVVALCVLKGSFVFFSDFIRELDFDIQCEFLGLSSYGNSTQSSGEVKLTLDINTSIKGKDIIIVEDIIDTGLTMNYLQQSLRIREPNSITTVSFLHKPAAKKVDCEIDCVGFEIPNDFVVGYGLDYQGLYRNLPYVAQVQNMN